MTSADRKIVFAAWTLFGLMQVALAVLLAQSWENRYAIQFIPRVLLWALFTLVIAEWDARTGRKLLAHIPLFILACVLQAGLRRLTVLVLGMDLSVPYWVTALYFADVEAVRYAAALMLGRVIHASRELGRREKRTAQLKEEIAHAQLQYLEMQIHPHFLFNALGSISELTHEAPAVASRMVEHLRSLLRYATDATAGQEVTLKEELAALEPYLEIQRMRFPDWLDISKQIDPAAEEAIIPRMLLQPLVENAVRHGLSLRKSGGVIALSASVAGDDLLLRVHDNGVGLSHDHGVRGLGIGLANIRDRLATLYGASQTLELLSHEEGGVEVLLKLPYRRAATSRVTSRTDDDEQPYVASSPVRALPVIGTWLLAGLLLTLLSLFYVAIRNPSTPDPAVNIILRHVVHSGLWIALTPIVLWFARRVPISRDKLAASVVAHTLFGTLIAFAHVAFSRTLISGSEYPLVSIGSVDAMFWNLTAYGVLIAIAERSSIEEWIKEREVAAARMRAELTAARLSTMMVELKPEFLLSALGKLETLVAVDPPKAEALLTNLADFLRLTLESIVKKRDTDEMRFALHTAYAKVQQAV